MNVGMNWKRLLGQVYILLGFVLNIYIFFFRLLMQDLDTEIVVATARGQLQIRCNRANLVVDERQMNALF